MAAGETDQPLGRRAKEGLRPLAEGVDHGIALLFDQRIEQAAGRNRCTGSQNAAACEDDLVDLPVIDVAQGGSDPGNPGAVGKRTVPGRQRAEVRSPRRTG